MSDTNTMVIREFLEANDFAVITNRKFQLQKADPPGRYSIDIMGSNMHYSEPDTPLPMKLQADHMRFLPNVIVEVKGWHSFRFSPSLVSTKPELFYFVSPGALEFASSVFKGAPFKSILIISEAPANKDVLSRMENMLREGGIDHIIEFPTILSFLISYVQVSNNYVDSDTLQLLRFLKRYRLVKGLQLDLPFKSKAGGSKGKEY